MQIEKELIEETITTLKHAQVFISSKERMHKAGQQLYIELIAKLESAKEQADLLSKNKPALSHACPTCSCFRR